MPPFLLEIFCVLDDFCKYFESEEEKRRITFHKKRHRPSRMTLSEMMTLLIYFHRSDYKTFKHFYLDLVAKEWRCYFPHLVCYSRFVQMIPQTLMPLTVFMSAFRGKETGIYYVDASSIKACHNRREKRNKVFKDMAKKGKTSMGWFFGFSVPQMYAGEVRM